MAGLRGGLGRMLLRVNYRRLTGRLRRTTPVWAGCGKGVDKSSPVRCGGLLKSTTDVP
jgi:hypothetical protein